MAPSSPVELLEPSHVRSPASKPISCIRALGAKCVHAWAKIHVSYRGGRYSIERLLALDEYTRNTSLLRVLLVCVATPLPMMVLVISQEAVPLQDPTAGWRTNYGYWIRMGIVILVGTYMITTQAKFLVEGFAISWRRLILLLACSTVLAIIPDMIFAAYLAFPTPFSILTMAPAFFSQLLVSFYAIVGGRVVREMLAHKDQMIMYASFLCAQELMAFIYPAYQVLFQAMINTPFKLPVILLLPVIKLIVKNIILHCVTHMEDMMPEAVIFTVDFFNALYLATCMESAASTTTVLIIVATDLAQTATVLYGLYWRTATILPRLRSVTDIPSGDDNLLTRGNFLCRSLDMFNKQIRVRIRSCLPHRLSSADRSLLGSLEKLPVKETATTPDSPPTAQGEDHVNVVVATANRSWARKKSSWVCTKRRTSTVQPTVPSAPSITTSGCGRGPSSANQKRLSPITTCGVLEQPTHSTEHRPTETTSPHHSPTAHCNLLGETLEVLFTSECIVLTAYLETVIPIFYGNFMLIMVRLPSAKYHTELTGVTGENVETEVHTVFLFATLQILSFLLLSTLIRRNLGMKSLYQLAFVLETQMELIQSKLMAWVLMTMAFRVVHFGIDFTFKFDWIGNESK